MSIAQQIESIVSSMTDNNIPPKLVTVIKGYDIAICDIQTENGVLKNIQCSSPATIGTGGILLYLNGDENKPFVLLFADLSDYYTKEAIDKLIEDIISGSIDLKDYYTKTQVDTMIDECVDESELNNILSSYVTAGYANRTYAYKSHTHSEYITQNELDDLDINVSTLKLVDYEENPSGILCFSRIQKTVDELDIDLSMDTMSNGYLKINASLIERSS